MDGDFFSKISRLGRDTAEAALSALAGGDWDPFLSEKLIDQIVAANDGIPSLPRVIADLRGLSELPQLAATQSKSVAQRINSYAHEYGGVLDLMLADVARRRIAIGDYDEVSVLRRFAEHVLDRSVIFARGGPVDFSTDAQLIGVRRLLAPTATAAAETLARRPVAKLLGLSRRRRRLTNDSNLLELGGSP